VRRKNNGSLPQTSRDDGNEDYLDEMSQARNLSFPTFVIGNLSLEKWKVRSKEQEGKISELFSSLLLLTP